MSELFDKEVNAQKEFEKTSGVYASSCKPTEKCAMKMKETKKKWCTCKNYIDVYRPHTKTGGNNLDKLRVNDSGHNEGMYVLFV